MEPGVELGGLTPVALKVFAAILTRVSSYRVANPTSEHPFFFAMWTYAEKGTFEKFVV